MRIAVIFAPAFLEWPKEMMRILHRERPDVEIIGFALGKRVYAELKKAEDLKFAALIDFESQEYDWLDKPVTTERLKEYEDRFGASFIQRIVIADRNLGAGYVSGADPAYSELYRLTRDTDILQRYLVNMLDHITGFFEEHKPDILFSYAIAAGFTLALAEIAAGYDCKFLRLYPTRIDSYYVVDTSITGGMDPVREAFAQPKTLGPWKDQARQWLKDFRADGDSVIPEYARRNRRKMLQANKWHNILKNIFVTAAKTVLYPVIRGKRPLHGEPGWQKLCNSIVQPIRRYREVNSGLYKPLADFRENEFIFFPLHVDPEASTMVLAPWLTNQIAVIESLAKNAPLSMPIVVKDHQTMPGKRPKGFYKKLANMPGVHLVSPFENSHELIKKAAVTVTITGTVAWEAMLYGKPVIVMGPSPFMMIGKGFVYCPEPTNLDKAIEAALSLKPVDDDSLVDFIAAIMKEAFACPVHLLWGNPTSREIRDNEPVMKAFLDKLFEGARQQDTKEYNRKSADCL